jgi:hypothetical protein
MRTVNNEEKKSFEIQITDKKSTGLNTAVRIHDNESLNMFNLANA